MTALLRKAGVSDAPAIAALEAECFSLPRAEDQLRRELDDPTQVFLLAEEDRPAGYADFQFVLDEGYIGNVAVWSEFRRRGIGRALVEGLLREARERNLAFLTLEVRKSNAPAIALYRACGFETVGERRNYYEKPKEDAILMTARFDKE